MKKAFFSKNFPLFIEWPRYIDIWHYTQPYRNTRTHKHMPYYPLISARNVNMPIYPDTQSMVSPMKSETVVVT